jgi:hypothetical protein
MLRYFCPVILAGGNSSRFGINKVFFKVNNICFLDIRINFFFNLGFSSVYVSGFLNGYSVLFDEFSCYGPLIGIFTTYSYFFNKCFTHFIFSPVDINFFSIKIIFYILLKSKIFYSYCFNSNFFPLFLAASINVFYSLMYFILFLNCYFLSIAFFLNFILLERIYISKFCLKYFLNFNIYYNYFLLR